MRRLWKLLILGLFLAACSATSDTGVEQTEDISQTQVAQIVEQTMAANQLETQVALLTQNALLPTSTNLPANTPLPTNTIAPVVTQSPLNSPVPSLTLGPTSTPFRTSTMTSAGNSTATATSTPVVCNWVGSVKDLTVPEGSIFPADSQFTKIWRLKNIGSCDWTKNYQLVYQEGKKMGGVAVSLSKRVAPGETIEILLPLKAPSDKGSYKGWWIMSDANGKPFGSGPKANTPLLVEIQVTDEVSPFSYDLSTNFASATWKTDTTVLYPNGSPTGYLNYVQYTNLFRMETGKLEDEPAILVNVAAEERVRGLYPPYLVQLGDRFVAEIGCVYGITNCQMKIRLAYRVEGSDVRVELGDWLEVNDGQNTIINIDLSGLQGQEVKFVLDMESKSKSDTNQVFWFLPSIRNP